MVAKLDYGIRGNFNPFLPERGLVLDGTNVSASNLFNIQRNGLNYFTVDKFGTTTINLNGVVNRPALYVTTGSGGADVVIGSGGSQSLQLGHTGSSSFITSGNFGITIGGSGSVGFSWVTISSQNDNISLSTSGNKFVGILNGSTSQSFQVYNTYTDASNYERGVFDWQTNTNILTIGTQNAGTGSARDLRIIANNNTVAYFSASGIVTVNNSISVGNSTVNTTITSTTATLINLNPLLLMGS